MPAALGMTVIEVHQGNAHRYDVPAGIEGLLVQRVEPVSAAADAGLERGQVILHVNRRAVATVAGFTQIVGQVRPGDPLAVLVYDPGLDQRVLRLLHADVP
jgi:serine protease Do